MCVGIKCFEGLGGKSDNSVCPRCAGPTDSHCPSPGSPRFWDRGKKLRGLCCGWAVTLIRVRMILISGKTTAALNTYKEVKGGEETHLPNIVKQPGGQKRVSCSLSSLNREAASLLSIFDFTFLDRSIFWHDSTSSMPLL